jgi:NAD(P)-dependent dehydrogenase (short-subunit alcohol dehydrogenase family)
MRISGVAAIVTGGASGLGGATAAALADGGATVFAVDLPAAVAGLAARPGITYLGADVTDPQQVSTAVTTAANSGVPLRIVVNCAGIGPSARVLSKRGVHELDLYRKVIEVNLIGTINALRLSAAAMVDGPAEDDGERGVCVCTASIAAYEGQIGQVGYAASKGGVVSLTLPVARELARHGVRVMTIAPGVFETPMLGGLPEAAQAALGAAIPYPSRLGRPAEYAELVAHIVTNRMLNGEVIRLDGALRMAPR